MNKEYNNLIFLDTETTGVEKEDRLFQVAYEFLGEEKNELFLPPLSISTEASETTHFVDADIADKQKFVDSEMKKELSEIFSNLENILIAHNAKFDIAMLEKENLKTGKFIDTYKLAQYLDPDAKIPAYRLQYLRYFLKLEVADAQAHDALGDIRVLKALFERLFEKMKKTGQETTEILKEMIAISQKPILIKKFNFGKHKGKFVKDIAQSDRGYLEWLNREKQKDVAKGEIDEDWIFTLDKYLK